MLLLQSLDHLRDECLMASRLRRDANNMNIIFNCLANGLFRGLKKRADINIKSKISKSSCYNPCPPVVTILA